MDLQCFYVGFVGGFVYQICQLVFIVNCYFQKLGSIFWIFVDFCWFVGQCFVGFYDFIVQWSVDFICCFDGFYYSCFIVLRQSFVGVWQFDIDDIFKLFLGIRCDVDGGDIVVDGDLFVIFGIVGGYDNVFSFCQDFGL